MCGRYRIRGTLIDELPEDFFRETRITPKFHARYNIGPGQKAPILSTTQGALDIQEMLWRQPPLYLARAEGIEKKPTWKTAFEQRRCLIPMNGFYEWDERTKPRQPWHFHMKDDDLFMVAGLWANHESSNAYTLITTSPNEVVAQAHHRMPAIILRDQWRKWLDPAADLSTVVDVLRPIQPAGLEGWRISLKVNNWRNDGRELLEPLQPSESEQMDLGI